MEPGVRTLDEPRQPYGRKATRASARMGRKCLALAVHRGWPDSMAVAAISASAT